MFNQMKSFFIIMKLKKTLYICHKPKYWLSVILNVSDVID